MPNKLLLSAFCDTISIPFCVVFSSFRTSFSICLENKFGAIAINFLFGRIVRHFHDFILLRITDLGLNEAPNVMRIILSSKPSRCWVAPFRFSRIPHCFNVCLTCTIG
ncbi:hypothetical protein VNO80_25121 [Phaseolus coccineus]|uniref:Uncharacterized protein n=1 Tax=Phaseolus coccineus TaxID=3886 RepID=A0AAN9LXZ8_PHACN